MIKTFEQNLKLIQVPLSNNEHKNFNNRSSQHIFNAILNYVIKNSDSTKKLDYLTLFYSYEKILDFSRKKEYHICEYYIQRVDEYHKLIEISSKLEENGLNSLFHPAIAYYHYSRKEYNQSALYMKDALCNIDFMINNGFKDAIFMKVEQYLNSFRLFYEMKDYNSAIYYASEVLSYIINKNNEKKQNFCKHDINDVIVNEIQYNQLFSMFFDSIIYKIISVHNSKEEVFSCSFFKSLVDKVSYLSEPFSKNEIAIITLEILELIFTKKCTDVVNLNNISYFSNSSIPSSVKFLLIEYLIFVNPVFAASSEVETVISNLLANEKYRIKYLNP